MELPGDVADFGPGESAAVNHDVHRTCQSFDSTEAPDRPTKNQGLDCQSPADLAVQPAQLIRRTSWGIRGVWQNALTRQKAARLIGVVAAHLLNQDNSETSLASDEPDDSRPLERPEASTFVMGYDGRASSPDIYAGIVSAVLQNGCHVIDVGRSTPASIQEFCRSIGDASFSVIATGARESPAYTGFDIFDINGQPISVPWQSWNVGTRRFCEQEIPSPEVSEPRDAVTRLKHSISTDELSEYPEYATGSQTQTSVTSLEFPTEPVASGAKYRVSRHSGRCRSVDAESAYRQWMRQWFPSRLNTRVACVCFDPLMESRLEWLFAESDSPVDVIRGAETQSIDEQVSRRVRETRASWGICIEEDDRYMTVVHQCGRRVSVDQLSNWINEAILSIRNHVTTHVPTGENRIVMLDAGRPNQAGAFDVISDSMAIMGCICHILQSGSPLPRPSQHDSPR